MKYLGVTISIVLSFILVSSTMSLEPPRPGELEKYKKDGSYEARLAFAKSLENDKFDPALIQRKKAQQESTARGEIFEISAFPPEFPPAGLPSSGSPKMFALLVEFPDDPDTPGRQSYPHKIKKSAIENMLFGAGKPADYPYESLANYYDRSSYGKLLISRNESEVYGWYTAQHHRAWYESPGGVDDKTNAGKVIMEALSYYDNLGVDFSKYDNDGDGDIDYFCVFWTGPNSGWATLWWAWCDMRGNIFGPDGPYNYFRVDGKSLRVLSWQWESNSPTTVIHETGHALGLRDYYDYDDTIGPDGGVGGLDMMHSNWGDHNCFSKWLLGWVTPTPVIGGWGSISQIALTASADSEDCVVVMPGLETAGMFSEYFMVQNRSRVGNDSKYPTDGLVIWHVDATLNAAGDSFAFDNSYTSHKLLRLMEADGLEEIEVEPSGGRADAGDFYDAGDEFSFSTMPNSNDYSGSYTGVTVKNISVGGPTMTADIGIGSGTIPLVAGFVGSPTSSDAPLTVNFTDQSTGEITSWSWDFGDGVTSTDQNPVYIYNNPGTYTVSLTVMGSSSSDTEEKADYITVTTPGGVVVVVDSILPNLVDAGSTQTVTISGSGFQSGADVTFENGSGPAPTISSISVTVPNTIAAMVTAKSGGPPNNRIWDVRVTNPGGSSGVLVNGFTVKVSPAAPALAAGCSDGLCNAYPSPGNPNIWIPFTLANAKQVTIKVHDMSGRLIRTLSLGYKPAGFYTDKSNAAYWDGRNESGEHVASGIYFYTIQAGEFTATKKMVVAR